MRRLWRLVWLAICADRRHRAEVAAIHAERSWENRDVRF